MAKRMIAHFVGNMRNAFTAASFFGRDVICKEMFGEVFRLGIESPKELS